MASVDPVNRPVIRFERLASVWLLLTSSLVLAQDPPKPPPPLEFKGVVSSPQRAVVTSPVRGKVVDVFVREGQVVRKGEVVARIDATALSLLVKKAEAQLQAAEARLAELRATPRKDEVDLVRAELAEAEEKLKLAELGHRTLAETRIARQKAALAAVLAGPGPHRLRAAEAEVSAAQTEVALAKLALEATVLRAPLDGTVLRVHVQPGSVTDPILAGIIASSQLCELADTTNLEVEVTIHERNLSQIFKGQRCEVRLDAFPSLVQRGTVDRISPSVDPGKTTFTLWVKLELAKTDTPPPIDASARVRFLPR